VTSLEGVRAGWRSVGCGNVGVRRGGQREREGRPTRDSTRAPTRCLPWLGLSTVAPRPLHEMEFREPIGALLPSTSSVLSDDAASSSVESAQGRATAVLGIDAHEDTHAAIVLDVPGAGLGSSPGNGLRP
jgi:hypothetical protein